jgi:ABC-2 type transport system permease protein
VAFLVRDLTSLEAPVEIATTGILIFAPAIVYLFPRVPQWIGKIFPTYYLTAPVLEISQRGVTRPDVTLEELILIGLIVALHAVAAVPVHRLSRQEIWTQPSRYTGNLCAPDRHRIRLGVSV